MGRSSGSGPAKEPPRGAWVLAVAALLGLVIDGLASGRTRVAEVPLPWFAHIAVALMALLCVALASEPARGASWRLFWLAASCILLFSGQAAPGWPGPAVSRAGGIVSELVAAAAALDRARRSRKGRAE